MFINYFRYAKESETYSPYEQGLLANPHLPNVDYQQNEKCTKEHLADSYRVVLIAFKKTRVPEDFYGSYSKVESRSSVQLEHI